MLYTCVHETIDPGTGWVLEKRKHPPQTTHTRRRTTDQHTESYLIFVVDVMYAHPAASQSLCEAILVASQSDQVLNNVFHGYALICEIVKIAMLFP